MNLRLLKNRNLSLLILGQFVSFLGSGMQSFAFSLYILKLTGSGSQFASILAVSMIPRLILGPICGVFADWFDRKKIIVYLDLLSGLLIGGLYIISITSTLSIVHIYCTVISLSIISSLFNPAISTAIPTVVSKDDLMEANAINRFFMTICAIIYPIVAGIIYGIYGISVVLLVNAVSFILSAISEMFIDLKTESKKFNKTPLGDFKIDFKLGVDFIMNHVLIKKILMVSFISNTALSPAFSVGIIYVSNMVIKITEFQLGLLQTFMVGGTLMGTFITGYVSKKMNLSRIIHKALIIMGTLVCAMGIITTSYYLEIFNSNLIPYISLTLIGLLISSVGVVTNIGMSTLLQKEVPLELFGRVISVKETVATCAIPMGQIVFGFMFDHVSSYIPLLISGSIIIISATLFGYSTRKERMKQEVLMDNPLIGVK